ncbi:hypothetical protein V8C40DRAFT_21666 [Trichoderma camerunense]
MGGKPQPTTYTAPFPSNGSPAGGEERLLLQFFAGKTWIRRGGPYALPCLGCGRVGRWRCCTLLCLLCLFFCSRGWWAWDWEPVSERTGVSVFLINFWVSCYHACFCCVLFTAASAVE